MSDASADLPHELLLTLHRLTSEAHGIIEICIRDRLSLRAVMHRFLPALERWVGAKGALLTTRNEHLVEETFTWGQWSTLGGADLHTEEGRAVVVGSGTSIWTNLRVGGLEVGRIAVLADGDRSRDEALLATLIEAVCLELDVVLATMHTAAHKQRMIVEVDELLTDLVFDRGVDRAVMALYRELRLPDFVLFYRDELERDRFRYRVYQHGELRSSSEEHPHPTLDAAIEQQGVALLAPDTKLLRLAAGLPNGVETVLSTGMTQTHWLGKVVCSAGEHGFSAFALDVVEVMCEAMSQRLVDFNRERRHLAQFFAPRVITELLQTPSYHDRYLTPRDATVAVVYADINSFTKLSEQFFEHPQAIARFIDEWSAGAVARLWDHGGVFDKMVGDCVIGLFGPPFFRDSAEALALAALRAARAIATYTRELERHAPYDRIAASGVVPGLGVAIGINLCPMSVGIMGPNQDYTGFSAGMNSTARLQGLAGFRETLAMESLCEAVRRGPEGELEGVRFGEAVEAAVKNVRHPLRYRKISFEE